MTTIITITANQLKKHAPAMLLILMDAVSKKFYGGAYKDKVVGDSERVAVVNAEIELNEYSSVKEVNHYFNSLTNKEQFLK